jgi:hypothetical protein
MAYVLHDLKGHEAIAVGRLRVSPETMNTFCEWCDYVIVMEPHMRDESIPEKFHHKTMCIDVGVDRFGVYVHPELLEMTKAGAEWLETKIKE